MLPKQFMIIKGINYQPTYERTKYKIYQVPPLPYFGNLLIALNMILHDQRLKYYVSTIT